MAQQIYEDIIHPAAILSNLLRIDGQFSEAEIERALIGLLPTRDPRHAIVTKRIVRLAAAAKY